MIPLRKRPAWPLGVIGLFLALLYISTYADPRNFLAHRASAVSWTALVLIFSCGVSSVSAAMEAGRDRVAHGPLEESVRPRWRLVLNRVWPGILAGCLIQSVAAAWLTAQAGAAPDPFPWLILLTLFFPVVLHALLGHALGGWLRPVFSVPLTLLISYCWLGFTWTFTYVPIRYLSGLSLTDCCSATTTMHPRALLSLIVFSVLAGAGLLLITPLGRRRRGTRPAGTWGRITGGVLCGALAFGLALPLATGIGVDPTVRMPEASFRCEGHHPQVCLTAVQRARFDPTDDISTVFAGLADAGLPRVTTVVSDQLEDGRTLDGHGTADVHIDPSFTRETVVHSAASTYAADIGNGSCLQDLPDVQSSWDRQSLFSNLTDLLGFWSERTADRAVGVDVVDGPTREQFADAPAAWTAWTRLSALPEAEQGRWVASAYRELSACKIPALPGATAGR